MIEFFGLFIAAWAIPILVVLFLLGILFEHNGARGWAVFSAIVTAVVAYTVYSVPLSTLLLGAVAYAVVGLFWSFWRYKRHVAEVVEKHAKLPQSERELALRYLHPKKMLSTITAWIMIWPLSMIGSLTGDIINIIQTLISKFFRGVYYKIYESAVSALK
jgi:hypothetical protein